MTLLMRMPMSKRVKAPVSSSRQVLQESDFTYAGYYTVYFDLDNPFMRGLTHRRVSGNLRLITLYKNSSPTPYNFVREMSLPASYTDSLAVAQDNTKLFDATSHLGVYPGSEWNSIWYDSANSRLWSAGAWDYPQAGITQNEEASLSTRQLPASAGDCTNHQGFWGFEGIGQRSSFGKVQRVPSWFRTAYSVGEYVSLSGGYTSLAGQGLGPSFGPAFFFFPEPHGVYTGIDPYGEAANIPATDFKIGANHRSGVSATDWYTDYAGRTLDRGVRSVAVENYYEDTVNTDPARPTVPPDASAKWQSPAPNDPQGWGRWVWGDTYTDTGNWIDNDAGTQLRHGIVMVATLAKGKSWYRSSTLHHDARAVEIQIFDPTTLAQSVAGSLAPYKVRPTSTFQLTLPGWTEAESNGFGLPIVAGATYDETTSKLYILASAIDQGYQNRLYVYDVNLGA